MSLYDQDGGLGGNADKGAFNLEDLRLAERSSGNLVAGNIYEISARTDVDFTSDGAPDNNIGTTFIAKSQGVTLDEDNRVYTIDILWLGYQSNQVSIENNTLKIRYIDNPNGVYQYLRDDYDLSQDLVVGNRYSLQFDAKVSAGSSVPYQLYHGSGYINTVVTSTTFFTYLVQFTCNSVNNCFFQISTGAGEIAYIDNLSLIERTPGYGLSRFTPLHLMKTIRR